MTVNGVLNINKPTGETSMDMVRMVKRLTGEKKVGHGGTLDPIASGVLPICLGQATRLMDPLIDGVKRYHTRVRLGEATDTYDSEGTVTERADASAITQDEIEAALEAFRGVIQQVPPMYSALKHGGERLYDLARAGFEVKREPREVVVHSLTLEAWEPPEAVLDIVCGRGVYVRSLGHDLGAALGCGGHIVELERRGAGPFSVDDAVTPEQFKDAVEAGKWMDLVHAPDVVVSNLPAGTVVGALEVFVKSGRAVVLGGREGMDPPSHGELWRVYGHDGRFLALARYDKPTGQWRPEKVFDGEQKGRSGAPARS